MSKARLVITAVVVEGRPVAEVVREYGVSKFWVYELLARYRLEGDAAFEPRSRRPVTTPNAVDTAVVDLIVELRDKLSAAGLDAGPDTIRWHLAQHHNLTVSRSTISRYLAKAGRVVPNPKKRPKSSYVRFQARMPNETWQSDFTHYRLTNHDRTGGSDVEIISWLDDCTRYALHVSVPAQKTGRPSRRGARGQPSAGSFGPGAPG